jgi:hypothetical protein
MSIDRAKAGGGEGEVDRAGEVEGGEKRESRKDEQRL